MISTKHQLKTRIVIFFILLPILHACNNDDDKMQQTLEISGVVMDEKDEPVKNGKVTFITFNEYAHGRECSETFEFELDGNGYFSGEISNECNFNGGVMEMYVQDEAGNYVPGLYQDFDFMYKDGWMRQSNNNERNIYSVFSWGFKQSAWDYGMNSPDSKFYPLRFAYFTNDVHINIPDIQSYEDDDTLYIVTSFTYWDHLSGKAISTKFGGNKLIKIHPSTEGAKINVRFKSSYKSNAFVKTESGYKDAKLYFYVTCDKKLIQELNTTQFHESPSQFNRLIEEYDFDTSKYNFHIAEYNMHKVGTTNKMHFELTDKCGNLIEMQED